MASLSSQVLSSSFILLIIRLIQRSIGLISTLVLARVLTPNDFGIVAISVLVVHFCDTLSTAGSQQYIIQKDSVDNDDINSAWTIDIIMKTILWLLLVLFIPMISSFYQRPEIENALYVSSLVLIISAFKSPGLMLLRRVFTYKPIFRISIIQKVLSFSVVMAFVYFEPSYWALIIGDLVSTLTLTIGSYYIHSIRPKLCLSKAREQWAFSQWILMKGGVGYTRAETDTILVSKYFPSEALGAYHLARHLSIMPSTEIIAPALEPLVASFAKVKSEPDKLVYQFTLSLFIISLLIIPACVYMWTYSKLIVNFFLGSQWAIAIPVLSALSIFLFTSVINQLLNQFCIALGKVRSLFFYDIFSLILVVSILFTFINESLYSFSILRGGVSAILVILFLLYLKTISKISIFHIFRLILPIFIIAILSADISQQIGIINIGGSLFELFYSLSIFGLIYVFFIVILYLVYYRNIREGKYLFNLGYKFYDKLVH
jgi:lipopolysaccharide exporter